MSAPVTRIGWQCGKSRGVSFTPITPAIFAVAIGSPFFVPASRCRTASGSIDTKHSAIASRAVSAFSPTSTIRVTPSAPACEGPATALSPPQRGRA